MDASPKTWEWPEQGLQLVFHDAERGLSVQLDRADLTGREFDTRELRLIKALLIESIRKVNGRLVVLEHGPETAAKLGVSCAGDD
jgi:hypothetical protein